MFREWSRVCGSEVVCIRVWPSSVPIVALNSYAAVREALASSENAEALAGRPSSNVSLLFNPNRSGTEIVDHLFGFSISCLVAQLQVSVDYSVVPHTSFNLFSLTRK